MSGRGRCFIICMWNAAVCGEGEGLRLPGIVSVEILHQASSLWSTDSKYSSPVFALLWTQKPDFCALPLWALLPLVSGWIQQGKCPQIGGREYEVRILFPAGALRLTVALKWCSQLLSGSDTQQHYVPGSGVHPSPSSVRPWGRENLPYPNPSHY